MDCYIRTYTCKRVNPLELKPEDIDIVDIAHALAILNRWVGSSLYPISIAQHSVYVARIVERWGGHNQAVLQGLLHDGSEAYLGDVSRWLKKTPAMAGYREIEKLTQSAIYHVFGLPSDEYEYVKEADDLMVRFEGAIAFPEYPIDVTKHPFLPPPTDEEMVLIGSWESWSWELAEREFLSMFDRLVGRVTPQKLHKQFIEGKRGQAGG